MGYHNEKLFALMNFDGTTFNTFHAPPGLVGVPEAYDFAIEHTFGKSALELFHGPIGGFQSQEPGEIVDLIAHHARREGLKISCFPTRQDAVTALVDSKLSTMLLNISPEWPLPYQGVNEFFTLVEMGELPVDVGIATSGHDKFLARVFEVNGLELPNVLVSSDAIRGTLPPHRPHFKPFPFQIAQVHKLLLEKHGMQSSIRDKRGYFTGRNGIKPYMAFIGDNPYKDGGLAASSRISYIHVPNEYPKFVSDPLKAQFRIENFFDLIDLLENNREKIRLGATWTEVLFGVPDSEFFRPLVGEQRPYQKWLRNSQDPFLEGIFP